MRLIGPAAHTLSGAGREVADIGHKVELQGQLLAEDRPVRGGVEELRLRLLRLGDVEQDLARLGAAVRYSAPLLGEIRAVDVVYADHASWLRSLMVYTGPRAAAVNEPVLSAAG